MTRALVVVAVLGGVARADTPLERPEGFEVDREAPPPGQVEFGFDAGGPIGATPAEPAVATEPGGGLPGFRWAVSAQLGFLDRPMRLHTVKVKIFPIEQRETLALGAAIAMGPSLIADVRLPMSHQTGDRYMGLGDNRELDHWVLHDLGIGMRLRLTEQDTFAMFVRGQLTFGTGNDYQFAGESRGTAAVMLIGRATPAPALVLAANVGARFRGEEVIVGDRLLGNELFAALGVSYQLPAIRGLYCDANEVRLTAELHGVLGDTVGDFEGANPAEARVGITTRIRPWLAVAVRLGKGIGDQIGAERSRAMLEVAYLSQ